MPDCACRLALFGRSQASKMGDRKCRPIRQLVALLDFKATIDVFAPEIPRASFKLVKKFCFLNELM